MQYVGYKLLIWWNDFCVIPRSLCYWFYCIPVFKLFANEIRARVDEDFVCVMQELKDCRAGPSLGLRAEHITFSVHLWAVFQCVPQSPVPTPFLPMSPVQIRLIDQPALFLVNTPTGLSQLLNEKIILKVITYKLWRSEHGWIVKGRYAN